MKNKTWYEDEGGKMDSKEDAKEKATKAGKEAASIKGRKR